MSHFLKTAFFSILRNNRGSRARFSSYVPQSTTPDVTRQPQDMVMQTLRSSVSYTELLNTVSRHLQVMNQKHLLQVLRSLFHLHKNNRSDQNFQDVLKNPTFGSVCQGLKRTARTLEPNEYIEALKILSYLKVPIDTVIQQTMLQLVRHNINDLNIRQIMFLDFIVSKYDSSNPLVEVLKVALPLVFQIHLPLELDYDDLSQLDDMLAYAATHNLPERCINNIVAGLLMRGDNIDFRIAKNIVWSLANIKGGDPYSTRSKLLQLCYEVLAKSMNRLTYMEVLKLTGKLKGRIMEKHMEFYNEELFDAIAEYTIQRNENLEMSVLIARHLSKIGHTHLPLLDYLCRVACNDLSVISNGQPNIIFNFIHCISNADHKMEPSQRDAIRQHIFMNSVMKMKQPKLPYIKFGVELASLGYYDIEFMSILFSEEKLNAYQALDENNSDFRQILLLHEAARAFCSGYNLSPPEHVLKLAIEKSHVYTPSPQLEEALTMGLGGPEYHVKHVQLPSGLLADHIIAIENGFPIKIQQTNKNGKNSLHDLNIPQTALVICITKQIKSCYSINGDRLRGVYRLMIDVLEHQGYPTVAVNWNAWVNMPGRERVPYLMRDIKSKCQEAGHNLVVDSLSRQ